MPVNANNLLDAALAYAAMGLPVFPCRPRDKRPACARGFHDATTDVAAIRAWWHRNPAANIGMTNGEPSGLIVLDVDPRHGGEIAIDELFAGRDPLPDTAEAITGDGGRHVYILHPGGRVPCSQGELGAGVDLKGDGGYVVMPSSVHPNGTAYGWELSSVLGEVAPVACPA